MYVSEWWVYAVGEWYAYVNAYANANAYCAYLAINPLHKLIDFNHSIFVQLEPIYEGLELWIRKVETLAHRRWRRGRWLEVDA